MGDRAAPVAVVTGAGSGIGRAVSLLLGAAAYRVALVGRREARLAETAALIARSAAETAPALVVPADLSHQTECEQVISRVIAAWARLDVLVNNAALAAPAALGRLTAEHLEATLRTNLLGPFALVSGAWPHLSARGGRVICVSSVTAAQPAPELAAYAASKAGLQSLSRSVAVEGAAHGIEGYAVAPGAVETAMLRRLHSEQELPEERTLDPAAVARVIVDCALGRRQADNGRVITICHEPLR